MTEYRFHDMQAAPGFVRVADIEQGEMIIRLFEAMVSLRRPPGQSNDQILEWLRSRQPAEYERVQRMANAALGYVDDALRDAVSEARQ